MTLSGNLSIASLVQAFHHLSQQHPNPISRLLHLPPSRVSTHSSRSDPVQIVRPLFGALHVCPSFLSEEKPMVSRCSVKPYWIHRQLQQPSHRLTLLQDSHLLADGQACQMHMLTLGALTLAAAYAQRSFPTCPARPAPSLLPSPLFKWAFSGYPN